jgi:transposase InsO family protein
MLCDGCRRSFRALDTDEIHVYLEREGHTMGWDKAHRLWSQAGLQVPRKRPRRRIASNRPRPLPAQGANQVWAYDFVFDACANGQQLKCLTIIDEWTKECLAIDVQGSIRSKRVIEILTRLVSLHGAPLHLHQPGFIDPGRKTLAEWRRRKLQRQVPRRMLERRMVPLPGRSTHGDRGLEATLQYGSPAFKPRLPQSGRIQKQLAEKGVSTATRFPTRSHRSLGIIGPKKPGRSNVQARFHRPKLTTPNPPTTSHESPQ